MYRVNFEADYRLDSPITDAPSKCIVAVKGRKLIFANKDRQLAINCYSQNLTIEIYSSLSKEDIFTHSVLNSTNKQYTLYRVKCESGGLSSGITLYCIGDNTNTHNIVRYNTYIVIIDNTGFVFKVTSKGVFCKELSYRHGHIVDEFTTNGVLLRKDYLPFQQIAIKNKHETVIDTSTPIIN